ncbi:hypothetical protein H2203_003954 [Taxawa tesnikishii (nom. ined.)]|nr:hypothetical protein H2203_003954 [Dothideales sp. JES 119]
MGLDKIPDTMQAVQVVEYNKPYELRTVPVPKALQPTDLLVKVAVASNCHTDGMVQAGVFKTKLPCTASHEGAGTVVAVGESVTEFKEGDRVMCGSVSLKRPEKFTQYCPNSAGAVGVTTDGAFAEYVVVDSRATTPLPDKITFASAAPLACAGRTVWRGILETELTKGSWLALIGSGGGLGHLGIQFAKALGLMVVGVDARDEGLELSRSAGADVVVDARKGKEKVVEEVQKVTGE